MFTHDGKLVAVTSQEGVVRTNARRPSKEKKLQPKLWRQPIEETDLDVTICRQAWAQDYFSFYTCDVAVTWAFMHESFRSVELCD